MCFTVRLAELETAAEAAISCDGGDTEEETAVCSDGGDTEAAVALGC